MRGREAALPESDMTTIAYPYEHRGESSGLMMVEAENDPNIGMWPQSGVGRADSLPVPTLIHADPGPLPPPPLSSTPSSFACVEHNTESLESVMKSLHLNTFYGVYKEYKAKFTQFNKTGMQLNIHTLLHCVKFLS